jgi:hypothetical protein
MFEPFFEVSAPFRVPKKRLTTHTTFVNSRWFLSSYRPLLCKTSATCSFIQNKCLEKVSASSRDFGCRTFSIERFSMMSFSAESDYHTTRILQVMPAYPTLKIGLFLSD